MKRRILELIPQAVELHIPVQTVLKYIVIGKDGVLTIRDNKGRDIIQLLIAEERIIKEGEDK